jgi:hypothetical protein
MAFPVIRQDRNEEKWHFRSSGKIGMKKNDIFGHSAKNKAFYLKEIHNY